MLDYVMPQGWTALADIAAWGVIHAATGYAAHRLTPQWLARDYRLLRPLAFEQGGRWYRRRLRINRWKDAVPEAGALFAGGVSKRQLPALDKSGLELFVRETRRAELGHWWALLAGPVFVLWNPPAIAAVLIGYGIAINLPFIAIQRYNRFRTEPLLRRAR